MQTIICSGCSFTNFHATKDKGSIFWPEHLSQYYSVYNVGSPTNDNKTIVRSLIYKANELIKRGQKNLTLIPCWTFMNRDSIYIPNVPTSLVHKTDYTYTNYKNGYYGLSGNNFFDWMNEEHDFENEKRFFNSKVRWVKSNEEDMLSFLEWFHYLITFCEANQIKLKTFFIKDMLSETTDIFEGQTETQEESIKPLDYELLEIKLKQLFDESSFNKKGNVKKFNTNLYINNFYNIIDWEKYCWFYKNDYGVYGGVYEWIYDNVEEDKWIEGDNLIAGHPSSSVWKKFVNDILLKEVI